jgi:hypothetical protein
LTQFLQSNGKFFEGTGILFLMDHRLVNYRTHIENSKFELFLTEFLAEFSVQIFNGFSLNFQKSKFLLFMKSSYPFKNFLFYFHFKSQKNSNKYKI